MATTMELQRSWRGPALLSYGFRPFFLGASLLALLMMLIWVPLYQGSMALPGMLSPIHWHIHELLFGFVPAVVAGFLLTAVPNWTGRLPVVGWPLLFLFSLWLLGRAVLAASPLLPMGLVALVNTLFPFALAAVIAREIAAGKNWRNMKVLAGVVLLGIAQAIFHVALLLGKDPIIGVRLGLGVTILLIMLVGGRIIPSFTRNWLKRCNPGREPKEFNGFDKIAMIVAVVALLGWVFLAETWAIPAISGSLMLIAACVHLLRLLRWAPDRVLREPLLLVLHMGYLFVSLGFALIGGGLLIDSHGLQQAGIHAWTVGAVGLMTTGVMARASRGHSGRPLTVTWPVVLTFIGLFFAALLRIAAALEPAHAQLLLSLGGGLWVLSFALFLASHFQMWWSPKL